MSGVGDSVAFPDGRFANHRHFVACVVLIGREGAPFRNLFPKGTLQKTMRWLIERLAAICDGVEPADLCSMEVARTILAGLYQSKRVEPWKPYPLPPARKSRTKRLVL